MIERDAAALSIAQQCELLAVARSTTYYRPVAIDPARLALMARIDRQYLETPFYGARRMALEITGQGYPLGRKQAASLMRLMGLEAIYRRPRTSTPAPGHLVHPYLLRGVEIARPNQVWAADITYIPMARGFLYLVAIMDWFSRYVLAWRLSSTLDAGFCVAALEVALARGRPEISNTDQGSQFTSAGYLDVLAAHGVRISMDGRGRFMDNIFIERLWRSVKYEEVYLHAYDGGAQVHERLSWYFDFYNHRRRHQALGYRTPAQVFGASACGYVDDPLRGPAALPPGRSDPGKCSPSPTYPQAPTTAPEIQFNRRSEGVAAMT